MNVIPSDKSCDSQLIDGIPQQDWGVELLGSYARTQHEVITSRRKSLATQYWRLGMALNLARKHFSRGQWGRFLAEQVIEKSRACKARAIHSSFPDETYLDGLSVQAAYDQRKRKSPKSPPPASFKNRKHQQPEIADWLRKICQQAEGYVGDASYVGVDEKAAIISTLDEAINELTQLQASIDQQVSDH